ncbi:hypothetical protein [Halobacillus karajensis]|uniref:Uncharacterized protein n=1 Tax=Halobacillus karajensis TaxID=195088 RepID=A0A059NYP5_9BACI|nr:hypothetical protein [Halobacillus karajensis]CDQ22617.1 hypothetical protein BN983_00830 [Halobacillus karajensis]CDQ26099.1 hypothetical protein BN981_00310 [Halobacillus karajensis]
MDKTGYIVMVDGDYVESHNLSAKEIDLSPVKKDALIFQSKGNAEWVADRVGGVVHPK